MYVSPSTISNIESCYRAPTPAQAIAADEVFDDGERTPPVGVLRIVQAPQCVHVSSQERS